MEKLNKTIIHLGANKTGSTTLQRCLFAKSEELLYLGEDCEDYIIHKDTLNSLVSDDDLFFDYQAAKEVFEKKLSGDPTKTSIYSNEDVMASRVPTVCARRLKQLLPDAEILIVLRNQLTAIPSWYANHGAFLKLVPRCHWQRYVPFDDWMNYCIDFINYSPFASFFYHRLLTLYASLFGRDKIHILFYEDFVKNKSAFVRDLCEILDIDSSKALTLLGERRERTRNSERFMRYHKMRNWLFWNRSLSRCIPGGAAMKQQLFRYLESGKPYSGFVSAEWKETIASIYAEDNTKLAEDFDLPLHQYDYPVTLAQQTGEASRGIL
ncbi:sulfotransferase [Planctomycetota bacterium]